MSAILRRVMVMVGVLLVTTTASAQPPGTSALQGFTVVLVLGDVQDGATSDNIPPAARAALGDLKNFLPYRSYRVLDTGWVIASSATRQAVSTRIQGPDEQVYVVTLERMPVAASSLQVRFSMREASAARQAEETARHGDRLAMLKRQIMQTHDQLKRAEGQQNRSTADVYALHRRMVELEAEFETLNIQGTRYVPGEASLIDTSFNMSLGETVVVGTSRMRGGNKALIVLLTAATRGSTPRE